MATTVRIAWSPRFGLAIGLLLVPAVALAVPPRAKTSASSAQAEQRQTVDMFPAIEKGQIEVKVIPKDSTQVRLILANKTDKPLSVRLPDAIAALPVLAQAPAGGGVGTTGTTTQPQPVAASPGGMGGGAMFNLAPEQVGQIKAPAVCLEHGKPDPQPQFPYELKPLESYSKNPELREVCKMLGAGALPQRTAQVAVWHINSKMSWEELAAKQIHHLTGEREPYFSLQEVRSAMQAVAMATQRVRQQQNSQGSSQSNDVSKN